MEYIIHIKSLRVTAENEKEANNKALEKIKQGFEEPDMMIEDIEGDTDLLYDGSL